MDEDGDVPQLPIAKWIEALEQGRADVAAGRTIPMETVLAELEAANALMLARLAKKVTDAA